MQEVLTVKDFVRKDHCVYFDSFRAGIFYYNVRRWATPDIYQFQVPSEDVGGATLLKEDKAVTFMRWIHKSIQENTLIKLK